MAVRGCTFHLQTMTSSDWAHQATNFYTGVCGITKGCIATLTADKKISISKGYFYTYGRLCEEDGTSLIPVPTVTTTTHRMLVYEIDLSKINTKSVFSQGQYKIISAYPDYPNPIMENLDNGGTIFQMQFCTWDQSVSGITNFKYTAQPAIEANEMLDANRSGWSAILATDKLTYKSASAPTFVCNTLNTSNAAKDMRPYLSVGMKLKITQDAVVKYFFITAIDATSITLYGGTDYTLTNTAITNVCYSVVKSPYGFPMNPDKWMVQTIVNTFSRLSANGTFPDIGLTIPIGEWNATVKLTGAVWGNAGYWNGFTVTALDQFRTYGKEIIVSAGDPTGVPNRHSVFMTFNVANTVASNIVLTGVKYSAQTTSMEIAGSEAPTILRATCAYL